MNRYKELVVWQKTIDLTVDVYKVSSEFPKKEKYSLINQINSSATFVASNIAEGAGKNSPKEFYSFLGIAIGSLCELKTQLIISNKVNYLSTSNF